LRTVVAGAVAGVLAGALLVLYAVVRRLRSGPDLGRLLAGHAVLPPVVERLAVPLEAAMAGIATLVLAGFVGGGPETRLFRVASAASALLYGAFAGYLQLLRTRRAGTPCGCLDQVGTASAAAVLRSLGFAAAAALVALAPSWTAPSWSAPMKATAILAGGFVAALSVLAVQVAELPTTGAPTGGVTDGTAHGRRV
jgi:hypothetical protein